MHKFWKICDVTQKHWLQINDVNILSTTMKEPSLNKHLRLKVTLNNSLKDTYAKNKKENLKSFYFVVRKFIRIVIVRFSLHSFYLSFLLLTCWQVVV